MAPKRTEVFDLFGGEQNVRAQISHAIQAFRMSASLEPDELGELAGIEDPSAVAHVEDGTLSFDGAMAFSLMAPLGIPLDEALVATPELTDAEQKHWAGIMKDMVVGPVSSSEGELRIEPKVVLDLFVRLHALKQLGT